MLINEDFMLDFLGYVVWPTFETSNAWKSILLKKDKFKKKLGLINNKVDQKENI